MSSKIAAVEILGQPLKVRLSGDLDDKYLGELARYVEAKMVEIGKIMPHAEPLRVALVALLNFADENIQLQREQESFQRLMDRVDRQISLIEDDQG